MEVTVASAMVSVVTVVEETEVFETVRVEVDVVDLVVEGRNSGCCC